MLLRAEMPNNVTSPTSVPMESDAPVIAIAITAPTTAKGTLIKHQPCRAPTAKSEHEQRDDDDRRDSTVSQKLDRRFRGSPRTAAELQVDVGRKLHFTLQNLLRTLDETPRRRRPWGPA